MSRSQRGSSRASRAGAPSSPAPGLTLEVVDGPMDGARLVSEAASASIGRGTSNDLALPLDRSVSSSHAVLSRDDNGVWTLEDRRSTNGTWLASGRLATPQALPEEGDFVAGHAVIHFTASADGESFLPAPDALRQEARRLLGLLDSSAAKAFGAGVALAAAEGAHFVTDRHVARGIALTNPGLLPPKLPKAQVQRFFTEVLRAGGQWSGGQAWIGQLLQAVAWSGETFLDGDDAVTPRLLVVLREAAAAAADRHRDRVPASLLMAALFRPDADRLRSLASDAGLDPEVLRTFAEGEAGEATAVTVAPAAASRAEPARAEPPPPPPAPPPPPPAPARRHSSGDPVLDAKAHEAARGLSAVAALYGIAPPEERQEALRQFLRREVSELEPGQRASVLEQLQRLFPLAAGSAAGAAEMVRLRARAAQLEEAIAGADESTPGGGSFAGAWRAILDGGDKLQNLEGTEAAAAGFLREVWAFATSVETFIVGSVHNLTTQGATTDVVQLPGYRTSLRRVARRLAEGDPVGLEDLRSYLDAVERWLLVITAAYHEAPRLWFEDFWAKVNPGAVETKLSDAGWKRKLGVESIEFWSYYKEMVHAINPDLVMDEILRTVRRRAEEHFARLREGRSTK